MESTRNIGQDRYFLKILTFWSRFVQKLIFLGIGNFAQFPSFKWRNGSQNRNVLEKLSGTGHFWKFWLFSQSQSSTWSKLFLFLFFLFNFFFFLQAVRTGSDFQVDPGQTGVVEDDVIQDVMRKGHVYADSACRRMSWWRWCVSAREYETMTPATLGARGGAR